MPCIKCGRKLEDGQTFCPGCLEEMTEYPIKPGTPVLLPQHPKDLPEKTRQKKRELKPEEQIRQLKSANWWLKLTVIALVAAFALLAVLLLIMLSDRQFSLQTLREWLYGSGISNFFR